MSDKISLPGLDLTSHVWMQSHLDALRQEYETRLQEALQSLIETVDDIRRLRDDPGFGALSPAWQDGVHTLQGKLRCRLEELGVTAIETVGRKVDPTLHHVVGVVQDSAEAETIVSEELAGYRWRDKVLRMAKVVSVARRTADTE